MANRPVYKTINKDLACEECGNPPSIFSNGIFFCGEQCMEFHIEQINYRTWHENIENVAIEEA